MGDVDPKDTPKPEEEAEPKEAPQEEEKSGEEAEPEQAEEGDKPEGEEGEEAKAEEKEEPEDDQQQEKRKGGRRRGGGWQRENQGLRRELDGLRQELMLTRQGQLQNGTPEKEKTADEKAAEYIDSLVEKRLEARETQQKQRTREAEWQRRTAEVRAQTPDFDDVILSGDQRISPALEQALLTSEFGPAIMYQLAKSPAELARLSALPPLDAAREIGRLEAKLASSTPPPRTTKPALRPPVPPTSVNGSSASTLEPDKMTMAQYKHAMRRSGRS